MPNDVKKPTQTPDKPMDWKPENPADWKKIEAPVHPSGSIPTNGDWDPLEPKTNGMVVTFDEDTRLFRVMCGGITYEINWDDLFPPLPKAVKPPAACDPEKDKKQTFLTEVFDPTYKVYLRQTKCVLQLNCVLSYTEISTTFVCDTGNKLWRQVGKHDKEPKTFTRGNIFTCPCGG